MNPQVSSPQFNARLIGDKELQLKMQGIAPRLQEKLFKRAIKPALAAMKSSAKANVLAVEVDKPTNQVRKAIASKIDVKMKGRVGSRYKTIGRLAVFYGESGKGRARNPKSKAMMASLAHLIEFGFKLSYYFGWKITPQLIHARPFMKPAFNKHRAQAEATFLQVIRDGCEQEGVSK